MPPEPPKPPTFPEPPKGAPAPSGPFPVPDLRKLFAPQPPAVPLSPRGLPLGGPVEPPPKPITYAKLTLEGKEALKEYWKSVDKVREGIRHLKPLRTT